MATPPEIPFADLVWEEAAGDKDCTRRIYLGSELAAAPARDVVDGIVNCTPRSEDVHSRTCRVAVNDECGANILVYLDGATEFMNEVLGSTSKASSSVLVHCQMGISRSSTVVIAFLIRYCGMKASEALEHVQSRRPRARPNPGFWTQLTIYERRLAGEKAVQPDFFEYTIAWATRSVATFQTIHNLGLSSQDLFPELTPDVNVQRIMGVALDYVCGRGVLDADLAWLSAVARRLEEIGLDPKAAVDVHLSDGSEFAESWSAELDDSMKKKLARAAGTYEG
jgi:hypothetical protein